MLRPGSISALALAALLATPAPMRPQAAPAPAPALDGGARELGLALRRVGAGPRLLMIAAHPDDENTSLLATLSLRDGADAAYLSLTRGEGGQNGIGGELDEALGLLRSEELLAARALDGAEQFFTRAYDYGYSRNAEEAFRHWPRDSLLADVVGVIRRYRPDILVAVFSGTPRDGHGQHQASGILAREAFAAAGDPSRFPEQVSAGLPPHQPRALYQALWRGGEGEVRVETGRLDPLLGRSPHQVAMASRSRHRSQDMGQAQEPGPRGVVMQLVATADRPGAAVPAGPAADGATPGGADRAAATSAAPAAGGRELDTRAADPFTGVPTTLPERARALGGDGGGSWGRVVEGLEAYQEAAVAARAAAPLGDPEPAASALKEALERLRAARAAADALPARSAAELAFHLADEERDLVTALALASGLRLDVRAGSQRAVPGEALELELRLWNGGGAPVRVERFEPRVPAGWAVEAVEAVEPGGAMEVVAGDVLTRTFLVTPPADAATSQPYFLEEPRNGDLYRWPNDVSVRGLPFEPDPVGGLVAADVRGAPIELGRAAAFVEVDPRLGEVRRPVLVVPPVTVAVEPRLAVLPLPPRGVPPAAGASAGASPGAGRAGDDPARSVTGARGGDPRAAPPPAFDVRVRAEAARVGGTLRLEAPPGWTVEPASVAVELERGEAVTSTFTAAPPSGATADVYSVRALLRTADGREHDTGYELVDYPHIRPRPLFRAARARVRALEVSVPEGLRVGYVTGAGDDGLLALRQLGVEAEPLGPGDLAGADLDRFDVLLAGIRAYEVRPDLVAGNRRILDWVRDGGTFIVQYNKYEFDEGDFAPYPLEMSRPHDRVTDEESPVRILDPGHPVLTRPNRIGPEDFEGWVQERGLYFASRWAPEYQAPLAMADPGHEPLRGGLLVAPHGEGTYVYTGIALFRQLPEGVPGAYRLLANLLALEER